MPRAGPKKIGTGVPKKPFPPKKPQRAVNIEDKLALDEKVKLLERMYKEYPKLKFTKRKLDRDLFF